MTKGIWQIVSFTTHTGVKVIQQAHAAHKLLHAQAIGYKRLPDSNVHAAADHAYVIA